MNDEQLTITQSEQYIPEAIPVFLARPQTALTFDPLPASERMDLSFTPDPRQLILAQLFRVLMTPVRDMQVLESHNNAHLVFFIPHGFISYREVGDQKSAIETHLAKLYDEIEVMRKRREAEEQASKFIIDQQRVIDLDPVIPIACHDLGPRFNVCMRQLAFQLVYWQLSWPLQQHQAWTSQVIKMADETLKAIKATKELTAGERDFMSHYLNLSIANPAIWHPA